MCTLRNIRESGFHVRRIMHRLGCSVGALMLVPLATLLVWCCACCHRAKAHCPGEDPDLSSNTARGAIPWQHGAIPWQHSESAPTCRIADGCVWHCQLTRDTTAHATADCRDDFTKGYILGNIQPGFGHCAHVVNATTCRGH
jgi:hypothetical protein